MKMNKTTIAAYIISAIIAAIAPATVSAQGIKVVTKDGNVTNYSYEELDYVAPYGEPEYVDLGLSVKWATFNIGASDPSEVGTYFAWGEVEFDPERSYTKASYKFQDPGFAADLDNFVDYMTKYCNTTDLGSPDYKYVLEPEDDAANVKWGDGWRMPTASEMNELLQCEWTRLEADDEDNEYGIMGYRVTGNTGNSIFIPAGGYYYAKNSYYMGQELHYWTSSVYDSSCIYANGLQVSKYGTKTPEVTFCGRYMAYPVRPVHE